MNTKSVFRKFLSLFLLGTSLCTISLARELSDSEKLEEYIRLRSGIQSYRDSIANQEAELSKFNGVNLRERGQAYQTTYYSMRAEYDHDKSILLDLVARQRTLKAELLRAQRPVLSLLQTRNELLQTGQQLQDRQRQLEREIAELRADRRVGSTLSDRRSLTASIRNKRSELKRIKRELKDNQNEIDGNYFELLSQLARHSDLGHALRVFEELETANEIVQMFCRSDSGSEVTPNNSIAINLAGVWVVEMAGREGYMRIQRNGEHWEGEIVFTDKYKINVELIPEGGISSRILRIKNVSIRGSSPQLISVLQSESGSLWMNGELDGYSFEGYMRF